MKKALSKMLAMMLTAALLLSGCGGGTTAEKPAENGETTTVKNPLRADFFPAKG